MNAGRALDAWVAERVMGWKVFAGEPGYGRPPDKYLTLVLDPLPLYSTSIADAWSIVDAMERRGFWCEMRTPFMEPGGDDGYWTGFTPHGTSGWNGRPDHWTRAESLPLAVCLAALKVCDVEDV